VTQGGSQGVDVRLTARPEVVRLAPGARTVVLLVVEDAGHDAAALATHYRLEVSGIRRRWYTLGKAEVLLEPGARAVVPLALHPSLEDDSLDCYPIRVRASWPANPSIGTGVVITLTVARADAPSADALDQGRGTGAGRDQQAAHAPPTRRLTRVLAGVGHVARKAVGLSPDSAETPSLAATGPGLPERPTDAAVAPELSGWERSPVADTYPPSSNENEEERHMSTDDVAHRSVADVVSTAPTRETTAARADDQEGPGRDEQRRLLIAECWSLEQRWTEIRAQVVDLDAEWCHLVGKLKDGEDAAPRPLDWADGVLMFRDLSQHAARLSGLTEEALHTCKQYALALQRAMEGLEV